ncbi:MAG TPA: ABC transporter substrate-binding protein [Solirubrobacteraceae bacterium]|nr:ABC transporter substrate-binding protein [Solirubrobacteraceae bacterium]
MIVRKPSRAAALLLTLTLAFATGCGDDDEPDRPAADAGTQTSTISGDLEVVGVWTGAEQRSFQAVLDGFKKTHPNINVKYRSAGDNVPTVVGTAVEGGRPPDFATIAQPGLIEEFAQKGAAKPLDFARDTVVENYSEDFVKQGTIDGKLHSVVFKAANKSTVWFNVKAFEDAGVEPPATFDELLEAAKTLKASGVPAYSIAGADGWTLTDLFENIYLRQAGPEKYDQLAKHEIKWTDQSVTEALETMAKILGDKGNIAGGTSGALQTEFPVSVQNVFTASPKAAMVIEGDFVPGVVADENKLAPKTGYDVFAFPSVDGEGANAVVGGGDSLVMFKDSPAARALFEYLVSKEAHEIWAKRGGFSSPNKNVDESVYPDDITRATASAIGKAETFRFDMSDLAPASFGGTPGQGEWKILQDFLQKPSDVAGTARKLEASAAKAFK